MSNLMIYEDIYNIFKRFTGDIMESGNDVMSIELIDYEYDENDKGDELLLEITFDYYHHSKLGLELKDYLIDKIIINFND